MQDCPVHYSTPSIDSEPFASLQNVQHLGQTLLHRLPRPIPALCTSPPELVLQVHHGPATSWIRPQTLSHDQTLPISILATHLSFPRKHRAPLALSQRGTLSSSTQACELAEKIAADSVPLSLPLFHLRVPFPLLPLMHPFSLTRDLGAAAAIPCPPWTTSTFPPFGTSPS